MLATVLGQSLTWPDDTRPAAVARALPAPSRSGGVPVALHGVAKSFGGRVVLADLDLAVAPGSFVSVVGRSGEGKSTLLRLLAGLERPDAGAVCLDGAPVAGLSPDVTMMFQDARLLPWQSVLGNVGVARGPDWRRQALSALAAVGLAERAGEWPAVLSGGQKQRVALARALVCRPGLLLLDEPLGALDALTRGEMQRLIERIWRQAGFTAVLVTHDVAEAVALSDRVLVLRGGRVTLDLPVELPRPRPRASADAATLEATVLEALLA
jgi:sulfonate transport system ATP-binding protein